MADSSSNDFHASQKRLRNRSSQQAFRKRQNDYIKELEHMLQVCGSTDNERIAQLEADNCSLRAQLKEAIRKLDMVQMTLGSLTSSMRQLSHGIGSNLATPQDTCPSDSLEENHENHGGVGGCPETSQAQASLRTMTSPSEEFLEPGISNEKDLCFSSTQTGSAHTSGPKEKDPTIFAPENFLLAVQGPDQPMGFSGSNPFENSLNIGGVPGIWSHDYQMGHERYLARRESAGKPRRGFILSNSSYSDHIEMMRNCLAKRWASAKIQPKPMTLQSFRFSTTLALSAFYAISRPSVLKWYTATNFAGNIVDLLLWQIDRSRLLYSQLHVNYRPTALQLMESYPPLIDFCPFPSIRDKLILLHAANPYLDQIFADIATAYAVEIDLDKFILGYSGRGYIRVWDLVHALAADEGDEDEGSGSDTNPREHLSESGFLDGSWPPLLPAPDVETLFLPQYARQAFKELGLEDGVPRYKIDPSLFIQYPELYDSGADIIAAGTAIVPKVQTAPICPTMPSPETLKIYQGVAGWTINVIRNI